MKPTIILEVEPSETFSRHHNIPLDEVGCETMQEWEELSYDEQRSRLQAWADDLPEHPYWCVSTWDTEGGE